MSEAFAIVSLGLIAATLTVFVPVAWQETRRLRNNRRVEEAL